GINFPPVTATPLLTLGGEAAPRTIDDLSLAYRAEPTVAGGLCTVDAQLDCCTAGSATPALFGTGAAGDVIVTTPNTPPDPSWVDTNSFELRPPGSILIGPEQALTIRARTRILINGPIDGVGKWSMIGVGQAFSVARLLGSVVGGAGGGGGGGG